MSLCSTKKLSIRLLFLFLLFFVKYCDGRVAVDPFPFSIGVKNNWTWPMIEKTIRKSLDAFAVDNVKELMKFSEAGAISKPCEKALFKAFFALRKSEKWVVEMLDATGKIPSGILRGTTMDMGSYEECLQLRVNASVHEELFRGKYCMVGFNSELFAPLSKQYEYASYVKNYGKPPDYIFEPMLKGGNFMKHMGFWFGTCIPSTCTEQDVENVANAVAEPFGFTATVADCQVQKKYTWKSHEIVAVCIICIVAAFALIGTLVDIVSRFSVNNEDPRTKIYTHESLSLRCCKAFSIYSNTERMLRTTAGPLSLLHGIRFFSATWIILGHTYFFGNRWHNIKYRNLLGLAEDFNKYLPVAVIDNFTIPVGSFFFLSGFLLTYTNWTKLEKKMFSTPKFLFHKFCRIAPALMMTIVLFLGMPLIDSGPLWYTTLGPQIENCKASWWKNLLFISNLWKFDDMCLIHTWYLAALMQFHVIAVILLLVGFRWPVIGGALGFILLAACTTITALKMIWNDFPMPAVGMVKDVDVIFDYYSVIYIKPFAHFASYWIGMIFGMLVLKYRNVKMAGVYTITGWLLAISCGLLTVYGIYGPSHHPEVRAVYVSLHRIGWALSLGWVTLVCASNNGGFINTFLSWKVFQPLGHLSYLAYLLHPLVLTYRDAAIKERIYFGHTELVFQFLGNVVVAYFLAYICFIMIELPFSSLEVLLCGAAKKANFKNGCHSKDSCNVATITVKPHREHP